MTPRTLPPLVCCLLLAATLSLAPLGAADHDGTKHDVPRECFLPGNNAASIGNVAANGVTLQPSAGNPLVLELPCGVANLALSTTGQLQIDVRHHCVKEYVMKVEVVSRLSPPASHAFSGAPGCMLNALDTYHVPIGFDVADVHVELHWSGCNGSKGSDVRDVTVVDPPLPL